MANKKEKVARVRYNPDAKKYKIIIEIWNEEDQAWGYSTGWQTQGADPYELVNADILFELAKMQKMGYTINIF